MNENNRIEYYAVIPAQIVDCDDNKATLIMIDTNLIVTQIPDIVQAHIYILK